MNRPPPGHDPWATHPWARLSELKVGDNLVADSGFTCLREGFVCKVFSDHGELYVSCNSGRHWLAGQLSGDMLVGFWRQGRQGRQGEANQGQPPKLSPLSRPQS